jgi:hypothetical protein
MTKNRDRPSRMRARVLAIALLASGSAGMPAAHAGSSDNIVVVPPSSLPASAQRPGEAIFVHEAVDGRTILYIEQVAGAGLVILDVTDPGHVKARGTVPLGAGEAFDVTTTLGNHAALVQFRRNHDYAVLDLRDTERPYLRSVDSHSLQGSLKRLGGDGLVVTRLADSPSQSTMPTVDATVFDTTSFRDPVRVYDVKGVRDEQTNDATGTTFLLADDGLHVVRRLAVEYSNERREAGIHGGGGG